VRAQGVEKGGEEQKERRGFVWRVKKSGGAEKGHAYDHRLIHVFTNKQPEAFNAADKKITNKTKQNKTSATNTKRALSP
jgi:hypothetical protein